MDRRLVDKLFDVLHRGPENERKAALFKLTQLAHIASIPHLRRMAAIDDSLELRFLAKGALVTLAESVNTDAAHESTLDADEPERRILALRRVAFKGQRHHLDAVVQRFEVETDPRVLEPLLTTLGVLGGREHARLALTALNKAADDPNIRAAAIQTLDFLGEPSTAVAFVQRTLDPDPRVRHHAVRALEKIGREALVALCLKLTKSGDLSLIQAALFILGQMRTPAAQPCFEQFLENPQPRLRQEARRGLELLATAGHAPAQELIGRGPAGVTASQEVPAAVVAEAVAPATGGSPSAADVAKSGAEGAADPGLAAEGEPADGEGDGEDGEEETLVASVPAPEETTKMVSGRFAAIEDPSPDVRLEVIRGIQTGADREMLPALVERLGDEEDSDVKASIIKIIGEIGSHDHLETVKECLNDTDARVRANAVEAYASLAHPNERGFLALYLRDENNRVSTNVILAMWRQGQKQVRDRLVQMAESEEKKDRLSAVYAIGLIGVAAANLLNPLVEDGDEEVSQRAVECQHMLGLRSDRILVRDEDVEGVEDSDEPEAVEGAGDEAAAEGEPPTDEAADPDTAGDGGDEPAPDDEGEEVAADDDAVPEGADPPASETDEPAEGVEDPAGSSGEADEAAPEDAAGEAAAPAGLVPDPTPEELARVQPAGYFKGLIADVYREGFTLNERLQAKLARDQVNALLDELAKEIGDDEPEGGGGPVMVLKDLRLSSDPRTRYDCQHLLKALESGGGLSEFKIDVKVLVDRIRKAEIDLREVEKGLTSACADRSVSKFKMVVFMLLGFIFVNALSALV